MADEFQTIDTTARAAEKAKATGQVGFVENLELGHKQTVLHAASRKIGDEAPGVFSRNVEEGLSFTGATLDNIEFNSEAGAIEQSVKGFALQQSIKADMSLAALQSLFGRTGEDDDPTFNPVDHEAELLQNIPRKYHKDIMANNSLPAAQRARARVLEDLSDQEIIAQQHFGGLTRFTSMLGDVDLPLTFASGGAWGGAKVGTTTYSALRSAGVGARVARVGQSFVQNGFGGAQAGALVGVANLGIREGGDVTDAINYTVMGMVGGAALAATGRAAGEVVNGSLTKLADNYADQIARNAPELKADPTVNEASIPVDSIIPTNAPVSEAGEAYARIIDTPTRTAEDLPVGVTGQEALDRLNKFWSGVRKGHMTEEEFVPVFDDLTARGLQDLSVIKEGAERVVLSSGSHPDIVIKVGKKSQKFGTNPSVLNPIGGTKVGDLFIEVYDRVTPVSKKEHSAALASLEERGVQPTDPNPGNLGKTDTGDFVIIDGQVKGDRNYSSIPDLNKSLPTSGMKGSELFGDRGSVGARGDLPDTAFAPERVLEDPLGKMSTRSKEIIDNAHAFNHDNGFYDRRAEAEDSFIQKISNSPWTTIVGTGFQAKMYNSKSAVMNWMGQTIFESSSGYLRGKATASVLMETYTRQIQTAIDPARDAMRQWAKESGNTVVAGHGVSQAGRKQFFREVMLERNARRHGRTYSNNAQVKAAADAYDNAATVSHGVGKGKDGQRAIDGFEDVLDNPHYTPYVWGGKIAAMIAKADDPKATAKAMQDGLARGYRRAGMAGGKDADAVANAVIRRAQLGESEIDMSVVSLLQADGREFLEDALIQSGVGRAEVDGIMSRLGQDVSERGKEGFVKHRNELDMETPFDLPDGTQLQLIDLLSNNLDSDWQRYTRRISGAGALARHGITNRAQRKEIFEAIHVEQRALGEPITPIGELEAMFTNFDGGATKGFAKFDGQEPAAQGAVAATAKRLVNLAWLNKLGLTQLGETSAMITQHGMAGWWQRGPMALIDKEIRSGNKRVLDDLAYMTGRIGQDHHHFAEHMNLDEVSNLDGMTMMDKLQGLTSDASYVQGFTSMFNTIRGVQQQTAALGAADSVIRAAKKDLDSTGGISDKLAERVWGDYGIDVSDLGRIGTLIQNGTIEFSTRGKSTYVDVLKMDAWDADLADTFAAAIMRNVNQVVQKSMAGESDAWMHSAWGGIMTHLKTFPMQATQKQFVRHFRHNDPMAYGAVGMSMATAMVVSNLRSALDGRELSQEEHAKRAFSYSNMTGFIPMAYDPLMTIMGLEDKRINQFSPHSEITPPVISFGNDAIRLPGALAKSAVGQANGADIAALRTTPFANTILYGDMIKGIASRNRE